MVCLDTTARVFLDDRCHHDELDEIAEAAGYSKGAVYSNFGGKAELFLAVYDAHLELRAQSYTELALEGHDLDEDYRRFARFRLEADEREPAWEPLPAPEFWTYAARRDDLRAAVSERRERFLDVIAELIETLANRARCDTDPAARSRRARPPCCAASAVERMLDSAATSIDVLAEMHAAYMKGLTRP